MSVHRLRSVFHPTDFSESDEAAFIHAVRIALACRCSVELMHVGAAGEEIHWSEFPSVRRLLARWGMVPADAAVDDVLRTGLHPVKIRRHSSDPAEEIAAHVERSKPDLVVLSTHQRHGLDRTLHPSNAERVARVSHNQTLFVPRGIQGFIDPTTGHPRLLNILVPVDERPSAQVAVDAAAAWIEKLGCRGVHWVGLHVSTSGRFPAIRLPSGPGWSGELKAWDGNVVERILETAAALDAGLIVMPTAGHHGFLDAIRGSTTERVLKDCPCPLLAVNMAPPAPSDADT
jgi:nucleotide-binding universal stress UspA family protein